MSPSENKTCPICLVDLDQEDQQGIRIGVCPQCRSLWLERGELDRARGQECPKFLRPDFFERAPARESSRG